jgi:hypothetical protein
MTVFGKRLKTLLLACYLAFGAVGNAQAARLFDDSTSDFLETATAAVTAPPFTACGWFRSDDNTDGFQVLWSVGQAGTDNYWRVRLRDGPLNVQFQSEQTMPSRSSSFRTTNTWTQDTWHCWCLIEASATDHRIFLDGAGKNTDTTDVAPNSPDTTAIGRSDDGSPADNFSGDLGHTVMWDFAFTDDEARVVCEPTFRMWLYRPAQQTNYWPVNGQGTEPDVRGTVDLTVTGATVSEEPPIPHPVIAP